MAIIIYLLIQVIFTALGALSHMGLENLDVSSPRQKNT